MKYRAKVLSDVDPDKLGRIKVYCPIVWGNTKSPWCYPCLPFNNLVLPKEGCTVWIEFEKDDVKSTPIYVGTWGDIESWKEMYEG